MLPPAHTAADDGLATVVTVGNGFTVILCVAVFEQLFASVPVTVYVWSAVTVNACPSVLPSDHVYVDAPVPFNVTVDPEQTGVDGEAVAPTVGNACTDTVALPLPVPVHDPADIDTIVYVPPADTDTNLLIVVDVIVPLVVVPSLYVKLHGGLPAVKSKLILVLPPGQNAPPPLIVAVGVV